MLLILSPLLRFALFVALPAGNGGRPQLVELEKGRSLRQVAAELEKKGIISSGRLFVIYARFHGGESRVQAGVYQFDDGMKPAQILTKMVAGDFYQRLFALPEGYSTFQMAEMLEKRGLFTRASILKACQDRKLLAALGIEAPSAEGYLLPGSYNILPGRSESDLIREMVQRHQELFKARFHESCKQRGISKRELLTLASMIEKEAVLAEEKPLIAAVFANRLKKGMRLQSDPTALYGVRPFAGKVSRQDILNPTPYNTYLIPGLPPGPIGNPGADAIAAVLNHPKSAQLYFVARGDGSHQFSATLTQHNEAVRKYLKSPLIRLTHGSSADTPR